MNNEFWKQYGLRRTECRAAVVSILELQDTALSAQELREAVGDQFDRTTFYRTMLTLEERGVIHRVVVDSEVVKYVLNARQEHTEQHAHFVCDVCRQVWCLTHLALPRYELRSGFKASRVECIVHGVCAACSQRPHHRR